MKKTLALLLTLALSMAALTGCGSKTDAPAADSTDSTTGTETSAALSGSVSTNGSTSMEKVIGILSEQFMADNSGVSVTYDPTGSGAGIEAASNGSADIGLSSRALKDEEIAGGLTGTTVALDGIAVIVNAGSKVEDLSVEQIAQIFTGEITDWSEVGGEAGTEETVLDGSYAIQRPFVLVTRTGEALSPAAQAFFDFATSSAANDLIKSAGAVPVAQ